MLGLARSRGICLVFQNETECATFDQLLLIGQAALATAFIVFVTVACYYLGLVIFDRLAGGPPGDEQ